MPDELQQLFEDGTSGRAETRHLLVLTRRGQPLLYLPRNRTQALRGLSLYPAQRTPARMVRRIMRLACTLNLTGLFPSTALTVRQDAPLAQFIGTVFKRSSLPSFAILAGNPNAAGRRFIFLLFDESNHPCAVVKAGVSPLAIQLLEQEARILAHPPAAVMGMPELRGVHRSPELGAMVLDYIEGETPQINTRGRMSQVLESWIDRSRTVNSRDVPAWQRLIAVCPDHPVLKTIRPRIEAATFHPALYHGDFAPWNIRVACDGSWHVLDWERGELTGMPCWDWFHYRVQVGLLVKRLTATVHAEQIERWLMEREVRKYAAHAGTRDILKELLLAYLLYSIEITKPREGLQATRELLNALTQKWNVV